MKLNCNWIFFTFQIPAKPAYIRVKVWRALKACGAVSLKGSVYALPNSNGAEESFEWLRKQIMSDGGSASLFLAEPLSGISSSQIRGLFSEARTKDYIEWLKEVEKVSKSQRQISKSKLNELQISLEQIQKIDFFGCPKAVEARKFLAKLRAPDKKEIQSASVVLTKLKIKDYKSKTWVTRKGVHIDRLASAWFIRRFIDKRAKFKFVEASAYQYHSSEIRFDMFEAEFTHVGDLCTFEVLVQRFAAADNGLLELSKIIHDLDINDNKYQRSETLGISQIIKGIVQRYPSDSERILHSSEIFENIYLGFSS